MQYQLECRISSLNLKWDLGDIVPRGENSSTHHMLWSMTRSNNKEKGGVDAVKNGLWVDLLLGRHRGLLWYCCCLAFSFSKLFETGCLLTLKINVVFISFWLLCLALWCLTSCYRCMIQLEKPGHTAGSDTIFVQIYMDPPPEVPGPYWFQAQKSYILQHLSHNF